MAEISKPLTKQEEAMLQNFVLYCRDTGHWRPKSQKKLQTRRFRSLMEAIEQLREMRHEDREFASLRFHSDRKPAQLFAPELTVEQQAKLKNWL